MLKVTLKVSPIKIAGKTPAIDKLKLWSALFVRICRRTIVGGRPAVGISSTVDIRTTVGRGVSIILSVSCVTVIISLIHHCFITGGFSQGIGSYASRIRILRHCSIHAATPSSFSVIELSICLSLPTKYGNKKIS